MVVRRPRPAGNADGDAGAFPANGYTVVLKIAHSVVKMLIGVGLVRSVSGDSVDTVLASTRRRRGFP